MKSETSQQSCRLVLTAAIVHEWESRCIGDVIPWLSAMTWEAGAVDVPAHVAREIEADCAFYLDRDGPDSTVGERSAYRGLRQQVNRALAALEK